MSMTPDQFKKVGLGITASPSPFLTPRPERRRPDPRANDWNFNRLDKDKEVNVQVLLRCRPFSEEEQKSNVPRVISCNEQKREVTVSQNAGSKQVDKVFTFDKVFGPKAQQRSIYDQAISPIVNEVLEGFNCTVFAYGQTGTGKTYTMEGGMRNKGGELPAEAGVIPRAVRQIFDTLDAQNADYSMRVTFLELYNEEITDLLASEDQPRGMEDRQKKPISLMEDGRGCVNVRGLEEETVYSANEIYSLLERGAAKRRTADTLLNKRSSRSHSVFSITIFVKEAAVGNEDVVKCGKLNLVDLAGSENISRSGAREGRAREAGEINKSLLTLGRVINALVEHSIHIPYRDSKLTRLLRDSLGGKTKTCIIATVSPSPHCMDETLSTLDYAHRAKNIKNKPEANQKLSKVVLLKELYMEMERMKQDVRAAREKNGVYIPHERYALDEAEKKTMKEKIEQLEIDLDVSEKQVERYRELYLTEQEEKLDLENGLKNCKMNLEKNAKALLDLQEKHKLAISTLEEKEIHIKKLLHSENSLIECSKGLRIDLQSAAQDITSLFEKIDQKNRVEAENQGVVSTFRSRLDQNLEDLHKVVVASISQQEQQLRCMEEHVSSFIASKRDTTQVLESKINKLMESYSSGMKTLKDLAYMLQTNACSDLEHLKSTISAKAVDADNFLVTAVSEAKELIDDIQRTLHDQKHLLTLSAKQQQEGLHRTLISAHDISKATIGFFSDLQNHASRVHIAIEESETHSFNKLTKFEETFKEETAREEKLALEKIAGILGTLSSKKETMVSEISRNIQHSGKEQSKRVHQELSYIQQVSSDAKEELHKYMEKVETYFLEDTFAAAEARSTMESCLQDCSITAELSKAKWENTCACINNQNKSSIVEMETVVKQNICASVALHEQFNSASSSIEGELDVQVTDISEDIKESLVLDQASKKEIDTMLNLCSDHLKPLQENHEDSISSIRGKADKSLRKDYQVDSSEMPRKRVIHIPTVASLEEMRTTAVLKDHNTGNSNRGNGVKWEDHAESKLSVATGSPNRMPFGAVN